MENKQKELEKLSRELSDWLKENFNPHTILIINSEGVKILETLISVPIS